MKFISHISTNTKTTCYKCKRFYNNICGDPNQYTSHPMAITD